MNKKYTTVLVVLTLTQLSFASSIYDGHGKNQHWASPDFAQQVQNPMTSNRRSVNKGEILFINNCVSCHGDEADGNGLLAKTLNPKPSDLRAMSGMHLDGDFAWKISNGRGIMPAWKGILKEMDIWHLVNYIQSLSVGMPNMNHSNMQGMNRTDMQTKHKH